MLMLIIAKYKYVYPLHKPVFGINEIIRYKVIYIMKNCFYFLYWLNLKPTFKKSVSISICNCGNANIYSFIDGHK